MIADVDVSLSLEFSDELLQATNRAQTPKTKILFISLVIGFFGIQHCMSQFYLKNPGNKIKTQNRDKISENKLGNETVKSILSKTEFDIKSYRFVIGCIILSL
jgi:hypothetical protein